MFDDVSRFNFKPLNMKFLLILMKILVKIWMKMLIPFNNFLALRKT